MNDHLSSEELIDALIDGCTGMYVVEAAVRLLHRHGHWLADPVFLDGYVGPEPAYGYATVFFGRAVAALDAGTLTADEEQANVLRIAASLAGHGTVRLRDVAQGNEATTIKHIAEAIMYADGFLDSVAAPQ